MKKIIFLKGLPASGKSSYAKELVRQNPGQYKRINKDDLRAMLDSSCHSKKSEKFILKARDFLIRESLSDGYIPIVDDTNFHPKHIEAINLIATELGAKVEERFFDVDLDECIKRDLKRANSVGELVIRRMYNDYLRPEPVKQAGMAKAILCDIDGTLAHMKDRSPYDWHRVGEDDVDSNVRDIVCKMSLDKYVILMSGRDEICRPQTEEWLKKHGIKYDELYMRPINNMEKDSIIKERLFRENVLGRFYIDFVLDDRDQVVKMWRNLGLTCFQVAEGNF